MDALTDLPRRLVSRVWQLATPEVRRAVLTTASQLGSGPVVGVPLTRRPLVLAPHPDDELIGCGGLLALLADRGVSPCVVLVTDGEATRGSPHTPRVTAARRRAESAAGLERVGVGPPIALGLPDGAVADHADRLDEQLAAVVADLEPDLVLAPWALDRHPDHLAVADACARLPLPDDVPVWGYEAHLPLPATHVVDTTDVVERKRAGLAAHATAAAAFDLTATLGLDRWRSLAAGAGHGYAEAFQVASRAELPALHAALRG